MNLGVGRRRPGRKERGRNGSVGQRWGALPLHVLGAGRRPSEDTYVPGAPREIQIRKRPGRPGPPRAQV